MSIRPTIKSEFLILIFILLIIISGIYFYTLFPDTIPVHWSIEGQVDKWSSKEIGSFLLPGIIVAMYALFLILPLIDPKKHKYKEFAPVYNIFKDVFLVFMGFIYIIFSLVALGYNISISLIVPLAIAVLFVIIGYYLDRIKPNWFIGIRTPWTMSSDQVWRKTHKLGSMVFIVLGFALMFSVLLPAKYVATYFIALIIAAVLLPVIYSYLLYRKE